MIPKVTSPDSNLVQMLLHKTVKQAVDDPIDEMINAISLKNSEQFETALIKRIKEIRRFDIDHFLCMDIWSMGLIKEAKKNGLHFHSDYIEVDCKDCYDTSYCASLMWKYQDMEADEITRKRRQAEFWVWYIKEAARLCDDPIKERIKVESFIPDTPILEIKNAQDFVRAINSELDYIKHEKMNDKIILRIYTRKHKKGLTYPACGRHSEHIKISSEAVSKLGKFKEWAVELRTEIHLYYCDNQDCPEKSFPDRTEVGLNEEKPTFYISQIKRRMRKSSMTFLACHS